MELEFVTFGVLLLMMVAAFIAGFIDSIAGGGGLISLPTLLVAGIPPHYALGTNKLMSSCGTGIACYLYGKSGSINYGIAVRGTMFALVGAYCGSRLALVVDPDILGKVLIFLLPIAAGVTFFPFKKDRSPAFFSPCERLVRLGAVSFPIGMYDGFFGPATGSFILIGLHIVMRMNLVEASGTTKAINLASNIGALVGYLWSGHVLFLVGFALAFANIGGNIVGSKLAIARGPAIVKKMLLVSFLLLLLTLISRYYW